MSDALTCPSHNQFSIFSPFSFLFLWCHCNSFFSFKSYCICLVSINLTCSLHLPFRFSNPPHPCIHLAALPPTNTITSNTAAAAPAPQAQPPLWYSQSHLQSDIFNGLITLSSHSLIEHLTFAPHPARPPALPLHLHPLTDLKCLMLSSHLSFLPEPLAPSIFSSRPR